MRRLTGRLLPACIAVALAALALAAPSGAAEPPGEAKCEFIASPGSSECMLPFPDDYYTKADPTSPTGRRIDFREAAMPENAAHEHIEVGPYNSGDGFSPGSVITLRVPGIETAADVKAMGAVPINRLGQYTKAEAPVVVIDASTGERWPIWVEIDSTVAASKANLEIHPAVNFKSGDRYIVALRNLKNRRQHLKRRKAFASTVTTSLPVKKRSTRGALTSKKSSRSSKRPASAARACTSRGTSPSRATKTTPAASSRCATGRSLSSATKTSRTAWSKGSRLRSR